MAKGDICNYIIFIEKVYQLYIYISLERNYLFLWNTVTYLKWNIVNSISNEHCNSILQHTLIFNHWDDKRTSCLPWISQLVAMSLYKFLCHRDSVPLQSIQDLVLRRSTMVQLDTQSRHKWTIHQSHKSA